MGVYIKGMEMPRGCSKCKLFGEYGCPFIGAVGMALTRGERNEDCPLIEVPDGHGRLIDADDFERSECNSCDGSCELVECDCLSCCKECRCDFMKDIRDAQTIIPADRKEK